MRRRVLHAPHPFGDINVTPLIDVVMCMIVFYLIVGKLASDQRSQVRLPASTTGDVERPQDVLVINVLAPEAPGGAARVVIDARSVGPGLLDPLVRERMAAKPRTVVQLRASRDLPYAAIEPVIAACRAAGVASVRLAAEPAS
jgi:biopolymer transport protein ExbD